MTKGDWVAREHRVLSMLKGAECISAVPDIRHIDQAYQGFGEHHRYMPGGLDMAMLVRGLPALGVKVRPHKIPLGFERIPGDTGVIYCEISEIMRPTDLEDAPFMLDMSRQVGWARSLGYEGIMSAEEVLYILVRSAAQFRRLPFANGWVRTRNKVKADERVVIAYSAEYGGLEVGLTDEATKRPTLGAIPEKFLKIAA